MRIRGVLAAGALALLVTACGGQSGPATQQSGAPAPQSENLRVELDAQMRDPCFRKPGEMDPPDCQKYITQLTSTPGAARKLARDNPGLGEAAKQLDGGIAAYRTHNCASRKGAEEQTCAPALVTISDALRQMHDALEAGTTSR